MSKYCQHCGQELLTKTKFCTYCGAELQAGGVNPIAPTASPIPVFTEEAPLSNIAMQENTGMGYRPSKRNSGNKLPVTLGLLLVLQLFIVFCFGWPGYFFGYEKEVKFQKAKLVDGIYQSGDLSLNFKENPDIDSFGIAKLEKADKKEGAISDTYELAFEKVPQESITMSIAKPKDFALGADEEVYLDIGVSVSSDTGEKFMTYDYVKATVAEELLIAEFVPAHYSDPVNTVNFSGMPIDKRTHPDKFRFQTNYTIKTGKNSSNGHFKIIFDSVRTKSSVSDENIMEVLSGMEQIYDQMVAFGFDMSSRTSWPLEVYTSRLAKDKKTDTIMGGQYIMKPWGINYSHININKELFENYNRNQILSYFGHEFTHFVYQCKVPMGRQLTWLNEAMAVYFEDYFGGTPEYSARFLDLFDGIYPASDTAAAGYARPSLVNYWLEKDASDPWYQSGILQLPPNKMTPLIDMLSSGGFSLETRWHTHISSSYKDPFRYAHDFFTRVVLCDELVWGEKGGFRPYLMHNAITSSKKELGTWDKVKDFFGKYKEIDTFREANRKFDALELEASELTSKDGQSITVRVPAYGARLVALTMANNERLKLKKEDALSITTANKDDFVLFKILSNKTDTEQGTNLSIANFTEMLKKKYCYMVLLVNTNHKPQDMSLKFKAVGDELPIEELVGTYVPRNFATNPPEAGDEERYYVHINSEGGKLVFNDYYVVNGPAVLDYDPVRGLARGEHHYIRENTLEGRSNTTSIFKIYFKRENGLIIMNGTKRDKTDSALLGDYGYHDYYILK